ncbi:rhodanese-like domain-containing protein [Methylogaea oryzae]|uniref:Rhodanese-like domain-containing protein n=1 Tax=Methylogaea oryzae TaxID=1295382 RepID=A0A8D4VQG1_9GAMM|nr:rhodanese-like domain-containing protein [Methylogaea oryzae]BBL71372.1 rhodanese-like domain-containing protein [Methylogaea oryzae]
MSALAPALAVDESADIAQGDHRSLQVVLATPPSALLDQARQRAVAEGLKYAGGLHPTEAWVLFQAGAAVLVDVRTAEERKFVGRVPDSKHVAWMTGTAMIRNPRFLRDLEKVVTKDTVILLLCRSGKRSAAAAEAASAAGFGNVFNVLEGFEGDIDNQQQRGDNGGWRLRGLPWIQD